MKNKNLDLERLGELIFNVAEGWKKQNMYAFDRSEMMYDCDLYDYQNEDTAVLPEFKNGMAIWDSRITTDGGLTWRKELLSIPKWLYDMYMSGKANFISWRKVEAYVL